MRRVEEDKKQKRKNTKTGLMTEDNEDINRDMDKDLLTLCEVHLAPVSRNLMNCSAPRYMVHLKRLFFKNIFYFIF